MKNKKIYYVFALCSILSIMFVLSGCFSTKSADIKIYYEKTNSVSQLSKVDIVEVYDINGQKIEEYSNTDFLSKTAITVTSMNFSDKEYSVVPNEFYVIVNGQKCYGILFYYSSQYSGSSISESTLKITTNKTFVIDTDETTAKPFTIIFDTPYNESIQEIYRNNTKLEKITIG